MCKTIIIFNEICIDARVRITRQMTPKTGFFPCHTQNSRCEFIAEAEGRRKKLRTCVPNERGRRKYGFYFRKKREEDCEQGYSRVRILTLGLGFLAALRLPLFVPVDQVD